MYYGRIPYIRVTLLCMRFAGVTVMVMVMAVVTAIMTTEKAGGGIITGVAWRCSSAAVVAFGVGMNATSKA